MNATVGFYLDKWNPRKDGRCALYLRITYQRKKKNYPTGELLTPEAWQKLQTARRKTPEENERWGRLQYKLRKAERICQGIDNFTFAAFEDLYFESRNVTQSVSLAFDKYITELEKQGRVGTASSYRCARNSFEKFKPGLQFVDITPDFLRAYEFNAVKKLGMSITTVGIYIRSLRTILNRQGISGPAYPFGRGGGKYVIPTGKNIKKALSAAEIAAIANYPAPEGSPLQRARDYWVFLYLANGMNVKDFCNLKQGNIQGSIIRYTRAKTERSKRSTKEITVPLHAQTWEIIKRWGKLSVDPEAYIFPHLYPGLTPKQEKEAVHTVAKFINKHMKVIARELGITTTVTTYAARHSFATVLKRSGASIELISELLGHSHITTTESYLAGFETDQLFQATEILQKTLKIN